MSCRHTLNRPNVVSLSSVMYTSWIQGRAASTSIQNITKYIHASVSLSKGASNVTWSLALDPYNTWHIVSSQQIFIQSYYPSCYWEILYMTYYPLCYREYTIDWKVILVFKTMKYVLNHQSQGFSQNCTLQCHQIARVSLIDIICGSYS
jgi:hypothetical protein